ncbi:tRNA (5-methylaminomethyl-2-thiouridine)(34)-methyltransferase MnmD [Rhizobium sp. SSA_523]|uniref:tRNA (5-methylaminomethyl-2-thiouridine)(34)-methyltransferase MnmD n=1 Tax=Rhizobium sp. SSA_523 TaxID=2952477 RepID=UPI002090978D|nr:tRNA (5-methylaminomethyl-2-thiouridine)(34)-methyltransferase MnmD [Rhizobium sp. SSA_523]MCO5730545.1 tRNA (5-methylaminomethyl-2-thiouridine)(34)-methyltransferase MnmD [Rhizobium sp. SSA_523]WKC25582.1 tRNA (5-methylaminomethyl-2-thiouridine)(34)-methyltransferase MnmD [Rhizobium sp. SSA_523]
MVPASMDKDGQALEWREGDMPYSPQFGDHFYCQTDGRLECGHVFLAGNRLPERWTEGFTERLNKRADLSSADAGDGREPTVFRIGELGFGTGLNACETWRQWQSAVHSTGARLHMTSFELYPMQAQEIDRALSHWPELDRERQALVRLFPQQPAGRIELPLSDSMHLTIVCGRADETVPREEPFFDAWFLDGFAPSRNPDMWSPDLMQAVYAATKPGGTFATYAAAGFVRRNLQAAGFRVERRPGFAGKREMLCGEKSLEA